MNKDFKIAPWGILEIEEWDTQEMRGLILILMERLIQNRNKNKTLLEFNTSERTFSYQFIYKRKNGREEFIGDWWMWIYWIQFY